MTVSDKTEKKLRNKATGEFAGRTLIQRIEAQMDKRRKALEDIVVEHGINWTQEPDWNLQRGRYEGFAATLAILRNSSVAQEILRSNNRLGIE